MEPFFLIGIGSLELIVSSYNLTEKKAVLGQINSSLILGFSNKDLFYDSDKKVVLYASYMALGAQCKPAV
ncbi:hypothetical protein QUB68_18070 [Microcoleus sp. A006_D1]|uniref:hypothetical protein n=1 Tax=Microcoleus sp. A006_D1 TaxID=3055267 RepID=UPI002FD114B9